MLGRPPPPSGQELGHCPPSPSSTFRGMSWDVVSLVIQPTLKLSVTGGLGKCHWHMLDRHMPKGGMGTNHDP